MTFAGKSNVKPEECIEYLSFIKNVKILNRPNYKDVIMQIQ